MEYWLLQHSGKGTYAFNEYQIVGIFNCLNTYIDSTKSDTMKRIPIKAWQNSIKVKARFSGK